MQVDLNTLPGKGSLVVACAECRQPMRMFPSLLAARPNPTCSHACRDAKRTRDARERNATICAVCGETFYPDPYYVRVQNRRTCGLKCRAIWQTGRVLAAPDSPILRFEKYRVAQDGCYGWTGPTSEGYGDVAIGRGGMRAHRFAWERATGETLTSDDVIGHVCDNPPCTRDEGAGTYEVAGVLYPRRGHLFKTTNAGNSLDMWQKGRDRPTGRKGEAHHRAKLTDGSVRSIRTDLDAGVPIRTLAVQHSVTPALIRMIGARQIWKHID